MRAFSMPRPLRSVAKIWIGVRMPSASAYSVYVMAIEYASSPVAQPSAHTRTASLRPLFDESGKDHRLQRFVGIRIAKEAGDADQDVVVERFALGVVLLQQLRVVGQAVELFQQHATRHATAHRVALVVREIDAGGMPEHRDHIVDRRMVGHFVGPHLVRPDDVRMAADASDLRADPSADST